MRVPNKKPMSARKQLHSKPKNTSSKNNQRRQKLSRAASKFLRDINGQVDKTLTRRVVSLSHELNLVLSAASPKSKKDLISGVAVDLSDLWEIGEEHKRRIAKLLNMQFPKDKKRLEDMLYDFDIRLIYHAQWHLRLLKRRLARLKHDLRQK